MDHTSPEIEFVHEALGDTSVTVRQSLGPLGDGRDATARWVWDGAAPMAEFLCEHPERVRGKTVVELGAGPGLPGIVAARLVEDAAGGRQPAACMPLLTCAHVRLTKP